MTDLDPTIDDIEEALQIEDPIDDLHEDEDEPPKKKSAVQRRIDELTARNSRLQAERDAAATEREEIRHQLEEQRSRAMEFEADSGEQSARAKLKEVRAKIRKAQEDGDFDAEDAANDELLDAQAEMVRIRAARPKRERGDQQQGAGQQQVQPKSTPRTSAQQPYVSDKANAWARKNEAWMNKPEHAGRTRMANAVFQELTAGEGMSPDDDGTYSELDARLNRLYNTRPKSVRVPTGGDEGRPAASQKKITREDREMMQSMNLDPGNKIHVEEWIKQNRSAA